MSSFPIGLLAAALIAVSIFLFVGVQLTAAGGIVRRFWPRYEARLQRDARFLFMKVTGARIARIQAVACAVIMFFVFLPETREFVLLLPVVVIAPIWVLTRRCDKRRLEFDRQLPLWLLTLANALKATPSIGEALASSARLIPRPIQDELEVTLKEIQLGTPIDQGLRNMRDRINTRNFSAAISTVLVARETGGDLPKILENSAASLREMDRLEGVLRTRTAEGKAQAYLMGALPFGLVFILQWLDPTWLAALTQSVVGYGIVAAATVLWIGAVILARKVLAVDM
jgi:tight adherence protein B